MASPKDPWLAANLSLTVAGLGQFYAGRRRSGSIFLVLELASWGIYATWILFREVPTLAALVIIAALPVVKLVSLIHARRAVLALQSVASPGVAIPNKNPWLSFFMSRFVPGLGHAYARRWVRSLLFLGLFVGWCVYQPPEHWWIASMGISEVIFSLIVIDAFLILRDRNVVSRSSTIGFILLFLITFQQFGFAKLLQTFVAEVYKIPSSAMEPTLMGDLDPGSHPLDSCPFRSQHSTTSGDRILISKLVYLVAPIERYDVVVFKFPLNQSKSFVKRVVGLPDEELTIHRGNIFVKRAGETEFRIARHTVATQDSLWIPVDDGVDYLSSRDQWSETWKPLVLDGEGNKPDFAVDRRELTTRETGGSRGIRFERRTRIDDGQGQEIGELQLAFDFELTSPHGVLFAEIATEFGKFEVTLATDAVSDLKVHTPGRDDIVPLKDVRLVLEQRSRLTVSVYDGMATVRLNGSEIGRFVFMDLLNDEKITESSDRFVAFGARGLTFRLRNLTLGRDVYYRGKLYSGGRHLVDDQPIKIPPGQYVMFGDNVYTSHDSRSWSRTRFVLIDGRTVDAEAQEVNNSRTITAEEVMERYHLHVRPTVIISADQYGNPWALYSESNVPEGIKPGPFVGILKEMKDQVSFPFVDEKFVVGRVQKVWWPLSRARSIR